MKKEYNLPEFLKPELINLEDRFDKAIRWVERNRENIHPAISSWQAADLYDFGINVTHLQPKKDKNGKIIDWI